MEWIKKKTTEISVVKLVFRMSPVYAVLHFLLAIIEALVSSGLLALAIANFVDTALLILEGEREKSGLYANLVLLLIVLGLFSTMGSMIRLVDARIRLDVNKKVKPFLVCTQAKVAFKHIENDKSWELMSRVLRDPATALVDGFGAYVVISQIIISVFSVLGLLISHVWGAVLVIVAFSVPLFCLSVRAGRKNYRAGQNAEIFNRRTEYFEEVLTGRDNIEERTMFGYGEEIGMRWMQQYEAGRKLQLKVSLKQFLAMKSASLILALISLLIAITLLNPVVDGKISVGLYTGIVSSVFGIINKLAGQTSNSMERISRIGEYLKDFKSFLDLDQTEDALTKPKNDLFEFHSLEFRNVRFCYPTREEAVLDGLSFQLEKGKHYALVGKNGAGKSTITKLLTGLYPEYEGEIYVNGKELRSYGMSEIKTIFSVVYQDFARYAVPVRDNILLGDVAHMKTADIESIVKKSGISDIVDGLKKGLDTPLGKIDEEGQEISGGQWQRIAIARSLISQAPVRILDEPTAALDPVMESRIYQEFEKLMQDKTTIFISHRLGSTKMADEILVIDGGKIAECGTHDELIEKKGIYGEMYASQRSWYL